MTTPVVWTNEPVGNIEATWTDPEGTVWVLTGPHEEYGWLTKPGIGGWGANPVTIVTDPIARGGVSVRHQRREPRRLVWPLNIYGETHMEWLLRYRALMRAFAMTKYRGPGVLRVTRPDGSGREVECYYEDGFQGEPNENHTFANPTLQLLVPAGYWRDATELSVVREYNPGGISYLRPYPTVSNGQVLGASQVFNDGDVEVWPSWTLTGPATQLIATNTTTGDSFTLTYTLLAGQQVTITVTPERSLVRGPAGENLTGSVDFPGAVLWSLLPGLNDVNFVVNGSSPGSSVKLSYYRQWEAA